MLFAECTASFEEADIVILGVPFDRTSSFRVGSRFAPNKIREESYNFEDYLFDYDISLSDCNVHDMGNLDESGTEEDMADKLFSKVSTILKNGKFPIAMGGEHSITSPIIRAFKAQKRTRGLGVITIDAHLDFRDSYLNNRMSHACVTRRISEFLGVARIIPIGIRSICKEEHDDAEKLGLNYFTAFEVHRYGIERILRRAMRLLDCEKVYLSLDIDGIDPAYAPGTGTPEPYGLNPLEVRKLINMLEGRLAGFDVVEVCPPYDNGNTSALAARLMTEVIAVIASP